MLASLTNLGAEYIGKCYDCKTVMARVLGGGPLEDVLTLSGVGVDPPEVFILVLGPAA